MDRRILILGLGNDLLSDDAAGLELARQVYALLPEGTNAELKLTDVGGLALMHTLEGYDHAIILDSIKRDDYSPGECLRTGPEGRLMSRRMRGVHDANLFEAMRIGESLRLNLPADVAIYLINGKDLLTFSDTLSPEVEAALPAAARRIVEEEFGPGPS